MSDLVKRLSQGTAHPVEVSLRPERNVKTFKEALDRGYVHIKFTNTQGGTELGVPIDQSRTDSRAADFESETGRIRIAGDLMLNYVKVRCIADIELPSMQGQGHLEVLEGEHGTDANGARASR